MCFGGIDKKKGVLENDAWFLTGNIRQWVVSLTKIGKRRRTDLSRG